MSPVEDCSTKLGQQKRLLVPRCLKNVIKKAGDSPLSLIDCIILKKYPVFYREFFPENGYRERSDASLPPGSV